jgi:hypothetical protein
MKNAVRLFAVLAVLSCAGFAKPASAVITCDPTRCNLFCLESGYSAGHCYWGACHCS